MWSASESSNSYYSKLGTLWAAKLVQGVETTIEEWQPDALGTFRWKRTDNPGGLDLQYDVTRLLNGAVEYERLDHTNAVNQGYPQVWDTLRVQYDAAGNTRYHWQRRYTSTSYELMTAQANFYGADDKLRVSERYSYTGADGKQRGAYDEYWYDALGRRVLVRTRTDSTRLCNEPTYCDPGVERVVWDGDQVLMELRASNTTSQYTTGDSYNGRVAYTQTGAVDEPLDVIKGTALTETLIPYRNWRGVYAGGTGTDGQTCAYAAGGWCSGVRFAGDTRRVYLEEESAAPPRPLWWGSLVRESAENAGLLYRRNRYYDPTTGQFTQEDPIGIAGGLNVYGYADGDPISFSDPFGLNPCLPNPTVCGLVVRGAGAVNPILGGIALGGLVAGTLATSPNAREIFGHAVASIGSRIRSWVTGALIWIGGGTPEDRRDRELERDQAKPKVELPRPEEPENGPHDETRGGGT